MITAATLYKFTGLPMDVETIEAAISSYDFMPCLPTEEKSVGFVEPRGEANGPLVESVGGQLIMRVMVETKVVPAELVREKAQVEADAIEKTTGRRPGKKETKELRENAKLALLPAAFPRKASTWVWLDRETGVMLVASASQAMNDEVVTGLVMALEGLTVANLTTATTPQTAMTAWLALEDHTECPGEFEIGRACELKSGDDEKAAVKFDRHNLDNDEVRKHIAEGKLPTRLAMTWAGRISFVLDASGRLSKIEFLDGVFEDRDESDDSGFDADVALSTGELKLLIPALVEALGGEYTPPEAPLE